MRVGVRTNDARILSRVETLLPPGWKRVKSPTVERLYSILVGDAENAGQNRAASPHKASRRFNLLYGDFDRLARTFDLEQLLERFESDLQLYVAERTTQRVFVHAGVIGWRGRAILLPGKSMTGKTTLVSELVRAGATYYSDEFAALDSRGRAHPFPKPLSIREDATSLRQTKRGVETFGGSVGRKPLPVGLVVVSEYKKRARRFRPRRLSEGLGALELFANTVSARRQPEAAFKVFRQIVARASVIKGARGEASETVETILKMLNE